MSDAPESGAEASVVAPLAVPPADAPRVPRPPTPMTLYICTTCRGPDEGIEFKGPRAGARLHAALAAATTDDPMVTIEPVECLSVCKRICTVAFAAPGKWTYVYGDLPDSAAETILEGARLYARAKHGIIPWKLRPAPLKTGVVSRVPPLPVGPSSGAPAEPAA